MAIPSADSIDVPLSLFSSLDTELSPSDIPEGISPDNGDICYLPGSVFTRPGYRRVFVAALRASTKITYEKSFVTPSKTVKNLYLTNDGTLWVEDFTNDPGVATVLFNSTATTASSCTAFGREYIALSDGVHGADIPIQYDGTSNTGNIWRVTQDGPAAPPTVVSVALPPSNLSASSLSTLAISSAVATSPYVVGGMTYYQFLNLTLTVPGASLAVDETVNYLSGTYNVGSPIASLIYTGAVLTGFTMYYFGTILGPDTGGTLTVQGNSLVRGGNTVTANTATPHGLQVGYQAQIANVPAYYLPLNIVSIVLNNETQSGIATVTTSLPHGLLPQNIVSITGVSPTAVGGGIANVALSGDVVTVTTAAPHGLQIGAVVNIAFGTNTKLNGQWYVTTVPSTTTFTYAFIDTDIASGADTGTVNYVWPLANINPELNYFTVQTAPSATTFTISLSYTDGTWSDGVIGFTWNGIFYVTEVLSAVQFQYRQYGPSAATSFAGTVTPYGQASPGIHQAQQCFMLASGAITEPSPPATFVANGGQYLACSNLAIGGTAVVGRILLFTGSGGAYFFYIPQPAQVNGLTVSTATQINDNTTTSIILDFADATLYKATACSVTGNDLAAQDVLGPCAGFFTYASRLQAWGEYNKVQNFLNMGFGGGWLLSAPTLPLGWTFADTNGSLVPVRLGYGWRMTVNAINVAQGQIYQSAYLDAYGDPILSGNTTYGFRLWAKASAADPNLKLYITLHGTNPTFSATLLFSGNQIGTAGQWIQGTFDVATPNTIPANLLLSLYAQSSTMGQTIVVTEIEPVFADEPYTDTEERISYEDNPEGFDGLTGIFGPEDDLSPIMNHGVLRNTLYIVTGNGLHETHDNGSTEPADWNVEQVDDECGAWSIASVARNPQGIGSGGKGFMAWGGPDGAHVFTGRNPEKCSQEIQSLWDAIDQSLVSQCWAKNDQSNKRLYFGNPLSPTQMQVLVLDYRNLSSEQIGSLPPVHISFTGKMIASDLTRKWTPWKGGNFYCGELMYHPGNAQPIMTFGGVNPAGGSNVYVLDPSRFTDDDFGVIPAYYTTYFFVSHEMEQALQVGSHLKQYEYLAAYLESIGTISFTPYLCSLSNPQTATPNVITGTSPNYDYEMDLNVLTSRCAFKVVATPLIGQTDSYFNLQKLIVNMKRSPVPYRGTNQGAY